MHQADHKTLQPQRKLHSAEWSIVAKYELKPSEGRYIINSNPPKG